MARWLVIIAAVMVFAVAAAVALAQERPGIGVDARGGAVIDPTKNVLDLVQAESKYQNGMREKDAELQRLLREADRQRLNDLAAQKQAFDFELARILKANADEKSQILATQVLALKGDTDARLSKQEQFRWETGGRSDTIAWIMVFIATMAAVAGPIVTVVVMRSKPAA